MVDARNERAAAPGIIAAVAGGAPARRVYPSSVFDEGVQGQCAVRYAIDAIERGGGALGTERWPPPRRMRERPV